MGIQTMGSQSNRQQSHLQPSQLARQSSSLYNLTLDEVKSLLGDMGKPLGSMNLDELLQNVWTSEGNKDVRIENEHMSSSSSLQRQASLTLARALSGKTVDDVWTEIQQGQKLCGDDVKIHDSGMTLGDTTLEDFLVQAGLFAEASTSSAVGLDMVDTFASQSFQQKTGLLPSPSINSLLDTKPGRKRDPHAPDAYEKALERRLRRKIKNRESAARSRERKQAYHNELVSKVSQLEQENIKLKKEKEFERRLPSESSSPEPKYQLRRISSALF